jgi:hypothetical protein
MDVLCLPGRGDAARADGPDRLVGDDGGGERADGPQRSSTASSWRPTTSCVRPHRARPATRRRTGWAPSLAERGGELARDSVSSSSPYSARRSECPTSTYSQPTSRSIAADISPVKAPTGSAQTSCAPSRAACRAAPGRAPAGRRTAGTPRIRRPGPARHRGPPRSARVLGTRAVHLPVTGDDRSAHGRSPGAKRRAIIRGGRGATLAIRRAGQPGACRFRRPPSGRPRRFRGAESRASASPRASTITRITGSVPEARSTTRPRVPSLDARRGAPLPATAGTAPGRSAGRPSRSAAPAGNAACRPRARRASGRSAHHGQHLQRATSASPVVVRSRHRMCPEVSPPSTPPVSRIMAIT